MRTKVQKILIGLSLAMSTSVLAPLHAAPGKSAATIVSPKRGTRVERIEEITGRLQAPGQPMVLIRHDRPNANWIVQGAAPVNERGYFKLAVRFGDDQTESGVWFRILVIVAKNREESDFLRETGSLSDIPDGMLRSEDTLVMFAPSPEKAVAANKPGSGNNPADGVQSNADKTGSDRKGKKDSPVAQIPPVISKPQPNERVKRVHEITGMVSKGWMPVVLVRAFEPEETWWVQPGIEFDREGRFRGRIHCGNDKTPHGAKFQVVVIALADERAYAEIQRGSSLRELPAQLPQSRILLVVLDRSP